jgi:hypothetical protein
LQAQAPGHKHQIFDGLSEACKMMADLEKTGMCTATKPSTVAGPYNKTAPSDPLDFLFEGNAIIMATPLLPEVAKVVERAKPLGIPLMNFVDTVEKVYVTGGVTGFHFKPRRYNELKAAVYNAAKRMVMGIDGDAGAIGAFMASDAHRHGYAISAREYSGGASLHLELSRHKCDAHIDSRGISPGKLNGVPVWADRYDPTQLVNHFIKDLAPSMLTDSKAAFLAPALNPVLKRLTISARLRGRDLMLDGRYPAGTGAGRRSVIAGEPRSQILFTLTFER